MLLASRCDVFVSLTPMPVYHSIADTLRKVLCKFEVNWTNGSRVIAIFVPAPQFLTTVTDSCEHS